MVLVLNLVLWHPVCDHRYSCIHTYYRTMILDRTYEICTTYMRVKHGVKSKYGDSKFSTKFKFSTAVYIVVGPWVSG